MELDSYTAAAQLALQGSAPALVPLSTVKTLSIESIYIHGFDELTPLYRPINICVRKKNYRLDRIKRVITAVEITMSKAEYLL